MILNNSKINEKSCIMQEILQDGDVMMCRICME